MTAGDEEYKEYPVWVTLLAIFAIAAVITVTGCALLFSSMG